MNEKQLLFALLKSVLEKKTLKLTQAPEEETLSKLYRLAKGHDVAHIAAYALDKAQIQMSDELKRKFAKQKLIAMYRCEQIRYDFDNICNTLEEQGINFIPLKGSVLRKLYPEEWMRTSCDIDILVKKDDCEKAGSVLCEKLKFTAKEGNTLHDYQFISPLGVVLELHYTLIEQFCMPKASQLLEDVWKDSVAVCGFSYRHQLSEKMLMLYNVVHMAKHFVHGGCGIKSFIDLYILENEYGFDREKLALLEKASLLPFYMCTKKMCRVWFCGEEYDETSAEMESYVLRGGVYGSYDNSAAMSAGKGESKVKFVLNNVFLPYDALCVVFPKLKNRKVLYPFYQIKRWFRVFNNKKRKKINEIISTRNTVSQKECEQAKKLLCKLGID